MTKEDLRILEAAGQLFRRNGFAATTVRQIAAEAGILPGSLHYRFSTKQEILAALMERGQEWAIRQLRLALAGIPDPETRLRRAMECHLEILASPDDAVYVLLYEWRSIRGTARDRIVRLRDQYESIWDGVLASAAGGGVISAGADLHIVRLLILGALNWTPQWLDDRKGMTRTEVAGRMAHIVFEGIRPSPAAGDSIRSAGVSKDGKQA